MGEQGQRQLLDFVRLFIILENFNGLDILSKSSRDPREYLQHVMKVTNMACLTPDGALSGDCDFLSGNLYARSLFGES